MLWFQPLPWAKWTLIMLAVAIAAWIELAPAPTTGVPVAIELITPGDVLDGSNTKLVDVPEGVFEAAEPGDVAAREVLVGEPVLASHVDETFAVVPIGWWIIPVALPDGARVGDDVRLILLDTGAEIGAVVAHSGSDDPFAAADGGVAVPPDAAAEAALAAANSRLAVLVSTG